MSTTYCWHRFPSFGMHARPYAFGQSTSSSALCSSSPLSRILRQKARRFTGITWNNILIPGDTIGYGDTPLHYTSVVPVSFLDDFVTSVRHPCCNDLSEANVKPTFLFNQSSLSLHLVDPLDFQGEPCQFHHQQMYIEDTSPKSMARLNQNQPH